MLRIQPVLAATSLRGPYAVLGAAFVEVSVWDLRSGKKKSQFDATLDPGGQRLALTGGATPVVVAAAYHTSGVAAFAGKTGKCLWWREDLKKAQRLRIGREGDSVLVGFDARPAERLDIVNGKTIARFQGSREVYDSEYSDHVLTIGSRKLEVKSAKLRNRFSIPKASFAVLDAAFSPRDLLLSESGGPLRCVDLETGEIRWSYRHPKAAAHILRLGYCHSERLAYGVEFFPRTGKGRLLSFELDRGKSSLVGPVKCPFGARFCLEATHLLTLDGHVLETRTGKSRRRLALSTWRGTTEPY